MTSNRVTPFFLLACLLPCILVSFQAGRAFKDTFLSGTNTSEDDEAEKLDLWQKAAKHRQTVVVCSDEECNKAIKSITLEQVAFGDDGFSQYEDDDDDEDEDDEDEADEDDDNEDDEDDDEDDEDTTNQEKLDPYGIIIAMDALRVNKAFLTDSATIKSLMMDTIWMASDEVDVSMETITCQQQASSSVICSAALSDGNYLQITTYPENFSLSLNLRLIDDEGYQMWVVFYLEKRLDVRANKEEPVLFRYQHSPRGFRDRKKRWRLEEEDIAEIFTGSSFGPFYRTQLYSNTSIYQRIDVWEGVPTRITKLSSYEKSLRRDEDSYESRHPELFSPKRVLFLDGVSQSTSKDDATYHETLVHPAMFGHANPKRVAIIGGGEGATLREVLKHKTVNHCKMIEIDEMMVYAARHYLKQWNDCSKFSVGNCFDEPRTDLLLEDAFAWFLNRFKYGEEPEEERFDVLIMDALDPEDPVEFAEALYQNMVFWGSLYEALTEDGILVMQVGMSPTVDDHAEQYGQNKNRAALFKTVQGIGFVQMHVFEEPHCGFEKPWSFLVAAKSDKFFWNDNQAEVELKIQKRILPRHDGLPTLEYFDGSTMAQYQRPSRAWENVYCRAEPQPADCSLRSLSSSASIAGVDTLRLEKNTLVATTAIPSGSHLDLASGPYALHLSKSTSTLISTFQPPELNRLVEVTQEPKDLFATTGDVVVSVFELAGCNASSSALTVDITGEFGNISRGASPVRDRQLRMLHTWTSVLTRDIAKGEAVFDC